MKRNIVYDGKHDLPENSIKLRVGDIVSLHKSDVNNEGFDRSSIGTIFENENVDEIRLETAMKPWGEVFWILSLYNNSKSLTHSEFLKDDPSEINNTEIYTEHGDYPFLRYIIKSGNVKIKQPSRCR